MRVIKHTISTDKIVFCTYPAKSNKVVNGLDSDIEYYEIQQNDVPVYNENKYSISQTITLTDTMGEVLKIAVLDWELTAKTQSVVLNDLDESFGNFIDENYPLWQRIYDINYPSTEGEERKTKETTLRADKDTRESEYVNNDVFPSFEWEW